MNKPANRLTVSLTLLALLFVVAYSRKAHAQAPSQYPILDAMAGKLVQKYQTSTCDQLWKNKSQKAPPKLEEQKLIQLLRSDSQMRAEFHQPCGGPHRQQDVRMWDDPMTSKATTIRTSSMIMAVAAFAATVPAPAQNSDLQQRFAAVKQSVAANQQQLRQYQWLETTQLTLKGEAKPAKQSLCQYGPDGTVQKTPIGPPQEPPSGRRMKQRLIAKKTEEMQQYMGQVKSLLSMYVPPDSEKMAQAYQAGKVSLNPAGATVNLVFRNYAQPGDQMTLSFDTAARKISSVNVSTYMDNPKDGVTLTVQMASLPDGTNYAQQTVLDATAKKIQVTTTNSNYQKRGPY